MEMGESLLDFNKICRLCLTEETVMSSIYSDNETQSNSVPLPLRIMACVSIEVSLNDGLPSQICGTCLCQVDGWYKFKDLCENADTILRRCVSNEPVQIEGISQIQNMAQEVKKYFASQVKMEGDYQSCQIKTQEPNKKKVTGGWHKTSLLSPSQTTTSNIPKSEIDSVFLNGIFKPWSGVDRVSRRQDAKPGSHDAYGGGPLYPDLGPQGTMPARKEADDRGRGCEWPQGGAPHMSLADRLSSRRERQEPPRLGGFHCDLCQAKFASRHELETHKCEETVACFECPECKERFPTGRKLDEHFDGNHIEREKLVHCNVCGKLFTTVLRLREHEVTHGADKLRCGECSKSFVKASSLNEHMRRKHMERRRDHVCDTCHKAFLEKDTLNQHLKTHREDRPFSCARCNLKFKIKKVLDSHFRTVHLRLKPYKCRLCSKDFARSWSLREHCTKVHRDQLPVTQVKFGATDGADRVIGIVDSVVAYSGGAKGQPGEGAAPGGEPGAAGAGDCQDGAYFNSNILDISYNFAWRLGSYFAK